MNRYALLICLALLSACHQVADQTQVAQNIFPKYAKGFSWRTEGDITILRIHPGADTTEYALCPAGRHVEGAKRIEVPVSKLVALSATHVGMTDALGQTHAIIGVSFPEYLYSPQVQTRMEQGLAQNVGNEGGINTEMVMAMQPQLLMSSAMPNTPQNRTLEAAGVPVLPNGEWMEASLLARAEWIKVFGMLFGKQQQADSIFAHTDAEYQRLIALAKNASPLPSVLSGLPYKGVWSAASGKSYVSKLLNNAGMYWHWTQDTSAVSLQLDFEVVYPVALKAEYWLWPGMANTLQELKGLDSRFADFPSVKQGKVYNYNKRLSSKSYGNDYWESGVVNPHIILADLIKIAHPALLPAHELYYHKKLE